MVSNLRGKSHAQAGSVISTDNMKPVPLLKQPLPDPVPSGGSNMCIGGKIGSDKQNIHLTLSVCVIAGRCRFN